jgi:hypothetical protein
MKRNLFDELKEGFASLQDAREKKITLRTHANEKKICSSNQPRRAV